MTELLDLSQIAAPKDTIRLPSRKDTDGKPFDLVNPTDLGILALGRLQQLNEEEQRIRAAVPKKGPSPVQARALKKCLGDAIKILIPTIDAATLALLPVEARERIVIAWTMKHYDDGEPASAEGEATSRRTTSA